MEEVAKRIGVSHATISRWESGDIASMKQSRIKALAEVLGLSPLDLLVSDAPNHPSDFPLTPAERDLIVRFRLLNAQAQATVNDIINGQINRDNAAAREKEA